MRSFRSIPRRAFPSISNVANLKGAGSAAEAIDTHRMKRTTTRMVSHCIGCEEFRQPDVTARDAAASIDRLSTWRAHTCDRSYQRIRLQILQGHERAQLCPLDLAEAV